MLMLYYATSHVISETKMLMKSDLQLVLKLVIYLLAFHLLGCLGVNCLG